MTGQWHRFSAAGLPNLSTRYGRTVPPKSHAVIIVSHNICDYGTSLPNTLITSPAAPAGTRTLIQTQGKVLQHDAWRANPPAPLFDMTDNEK